MSGTASTHPEPPDLSARLVARPVRRSPARLSQIRAADWPIGGVALSLTALAGLTQQRLRGVLVRPDLKLASLAGAEHLQRLAVVLECEAVADHRPGLDRARLEHRYR